MFRNQSPRHSQNFSWDHFNRSAAYELSIRNEPPLASTFPQILCALESENSEQKNVVDDHELELELDIQALKLDKNLTLTQRERLFKLLKRFKNLFPTKI